MVKKISSRKIFKILALLMLFSNTAFASNESSKIGHLIVFSENNMTYPLVKLARLYSKQNKNIVSVNFGYAAELIKNIDEGEPADVFISSQMQWIETMKKKGLVDVYNISNVAKDRLVLIISENNKRITKSDIKDIGDINKVLKFISKKNIPIVADSQDLSLGKYTDEILDKAHIDSNKIYRRVNEDRNSVVDLVVKSDIYCGIVFESSILNNKDVVVLKDIENSEIYYQALVIAGNNMSQARDFLQFIKTDQAQEIFSENGFRNL